MDAPQMLIRLSLTQIIQERWKGTVKGHEVSGIRSGLPGRDDQQLRFTLMDEDIAGARGGWRRTGVKRKIRVLVAMTISKGRTSKRDIRKTFYFYIYFLFI